MQTTLRITKEQLWEQAKNCPDCKSNDIQDLSSMVMECRKCNRQFLVNTEYQRLIQKLGLKE